MDFKKPNGQKVQDTAVILGGAVAGGMVSRGVFGIIHEKTATDEAGIKKEKTMGYVKRGALVAASLYAASGLNGNDATSQAVKGALQGVAVVQALDLVKEVAADSTVGANAATGTTAKDKFVAKALGLGCPCDGTPLALGRPRSRRNGRLRMPMIELPQSEQIVNASANSLEARLEKNLG